jgi:hypothetical protein
MTFLEFIRSKVGRNWIVARRTPRNEMRYGDDAVFLTVKQCKAIQADWVAAYPEAANGYLQS